jgi:AcrR family transcriptional regulator
MAACPEEHLAEPQQNTSRQALLDVAAELFTAKGYNAVSTRELTDKAGVNLGAIQYHFGSKSKLFIETILQIFRQRRIQNPLFAYERRDDSREEAALELTLFISSVLQDVCFPQGPDACKLIYREILGATSEHPELCEVLVSTVVEEFYGPVDERIRSLVSILSPSASEHEACLIMQSIMGQCSFYITGRAFIERLRGECVMNECCFLSVSNHIARFSLRGLGMDEGEIIQVIERADIERTTAEERKS